MYPGAAVVVLDSSTSVVEVVLVEVVDDDVVEDGATVEVVPEAVSPDPRVSTTAAPTPSTSTRRKATRPTTRPVRFLAGGVGGAPAVA